MNNAMKFIKKNIRIIIFVLVCLFGLNKCTQSCNRQITIDNLTENIQYKDSIISVYQSQIISLERDTADYKNQIRLYKDFGNQTADYMKERNRLDSINAVNNAKQKAQTDALIREIKKNNENK